MNLKELKEKYPDKEFRNCRISRNYTFLFNKFIPLPTNIKDKGWGIIIDLKLCDCHSVKKVESFIQDLQEAIKFIKENP